MFIGLDCGFHTAGHPLDFARRNKGPEYDCPIKVGNNVWIGGGSVVVKDIPSNFLAVGNSCKVIRAISAEDKKLVGTDHFRFDEV